MRLPLLTPFASLRTSFLPPWNKLLSPFLRSLHTVLPSPDVDPVAVDMINYAVSHANSHRTEDSYSQAILILEQCLSSHRGNNRSIGFALLAMSTLSYQRDKFGDAIEKLHRIRQLPYSCYDLRALASEALVGLHLQLGQDDASSMEMNKWVKDMEETENKSMEEDLYSRAKAMKGLLDLLTGKLDSVRSIFEELKLKGNCRGNPAVSLGEYLHATCQFSSAKNVYQKVIEELPSSTGTISGGCGFSTDEVLLAANCSLGQVEMHMGNFEEAQNTLTLALKKAEDHFGPSHPKVGVVLTSIGLMYGRKAVIDRSSSILIQEGLYRKAIDLLKAPRLGAQDMRGEASRSEIMSLARGAYAEVLQVQENRRSEGESMKRLAESVWRNSRISLAEAVDFSGSSPMKVPVIDTRFYRVL